MAADVAAVSAGQTIPVRALVTARAGRLVGLLGLAPVGSITVVARCARRRRGRARPSPACLPIAVVPRCAPHGRDRTRCSTGSRTGRTNVGCARRRRLDATSLAVAVAAVVQRATVIATGGCSTRIGFRMDLARQSIDCAQVRAALGRIRARQRTTDMILANAGSEAVPARAVVVRSASRTWLLQQSTGGLGPTDRGVGTGRGSPIDITVPCAVATDLSNGRTRASGATGGP
jgi:hypothetical protein